MQVTSSMTGSLARLQLQGRFDFNAHREFREAIETVLGNAAVADVEIDLAGVDYLDSSALGMLLLLRDRAKNANKSVSLANGRGAVKQVLEIANFGKLFTIR